MKTRSFKNFNEKDFCDDLRRANWNEVTGAENIDSACENFIKIVNTTTDRHAPKVTHRVSNQTPGWITDNLRTAIRERDFLKKKAAQSQNPDDWDRFTTKRNSVNRLKNELKSNYFNNKLNEYKNCSKKLWQTLKNLLPKSKSRNKIPFVTGENGSEISDNKDIANSFNNFFATIGSTLAKDFSSKTSDINVPFNTNTFTPSAISSAKVRKAISSLQNGKATGLDEIGVKILKAGSPILSIYLSHLFNLSLSSGVVPKCWKLKRISPLHKSGSIEDVNNYRPISILPVSMKIFEKLMFDQFYAFLIENNVLNKHQSGFRNRHSTQTAISVVKDFVLKRIEDKQYVGAILIDLKKAFDTVDHQILLKKLFCYGFRDLSFDWIESYLNDRFQSTKVNGELSDLIKEEAFGVPQGSVLGPLFFLLYINDINQVMTGFFHLYADDTIFIHHNTTKNALINSLERQMVDLYSWLTLNKLTLNLDKTECIFFGNSKRVKSCENLKVSLNGSQIKNKQFVKYLGVYIDQLLNWKKHISIIKGKGYNKFNQIRFLSRTLTAETKGLLINSLVMPYFNYCSIIWGSASQTTLKKLDNLYKKSTHFSPKPLLSFNKQLFYNKSIFGFQIINNIVPNYLLDKLILIKNKHGYNTRGSVSNKTISIMATNRQCSQSIDHDISTVWNSLPNNLRSIPSLLKFKVKLKQFLS